MSLPTHRLVAVFAVAAVVSLAQFHVRHIVTTSVEYDDAHIANVAKNLAIGFGYTTSYHEIVPFNPQASTGPVIMLPAAAIIRVLGNRYWVPTFAIVLFIWASLAVVVLLLRSNLSPTEWLGAIGLIAVSLMLFHVGEFGLLGDVPAALLACASLLLLCRSDRESPRAFSAGLLLGLAIQAKLIAALVLPSALAALVFMPGSDSSARSLTRRLIDCVTLMAGAVVPFAAWELWQLIAMGSARGWLDLKTRQYGFFQTWSGVGEVQQAPSLFQLLEAKVAHHAPWLAVYFGRWQAMLLFPLSVFLSVGAAILAPARDARTVRPRVVTLVLLSAALTHFIWWWTLDREGWYRHLLPGILYVLMTATIATVVSFRLSRALGTAAVILLLAAWSGHADRLGTVFGRQFQLEPRVSALLAARDEMIRLKRDGNLLFVGYGWWVPRDLEYLLPTVGNFKDAARLHPEDVAGKKIVLVRNEFFNWDDLPELRAFQTACDRHVLFKREPYVISECPSLPTR